MFNKKGLWIQMEQTAIKFFITLLLFCGCSNNSNRVYTIQGDWVDTETGKMKMKIDTISKYIELDYTAYGGNIQRGLYSVVGELYSCEILSEEWKFHFNENGNLSFQLTPSVPRKDLELVYTLKFRSVHKTDRK